MSITQYGALLEAMTEQHTKYSDCRHSFLFKVFFTLEQSFQNRLHVKQCVLPRSSPTRPHGFWETTAVTESVTAGGKQHLSLREEFMRVGKVIVHLGWEINF